MVAADPTGEGTWVVMRQDDNGQVFVVAGDLPSRAQAEQLAAVFEDRGHKQTYWVEHRPARAHLHDDAGA